VLHTLFTAGQFSFSASSPEYRKLVGRQPRTRKRPLLHRDRAEHSSSSNATLSVDPLLGDDPDLLGTGQGNQQPGLVGLFNGFRARTPPGLRGREPDQGQDDGVHRTDVFDALQVCTTPR
jgi:hypothetical protein